MLVQTVKNVCWSFVLSCEFVDFPRERHSPHPMPNFVSQKNAKRVLVGEQLKMKFLDDIWCDKSVWKTVGMGIVLVVKTERCRKNNIVI